VTASVTFTVFTLHLFIYLLLIDRFSEIHCIALNGRLFSKCRVSRRIEGNGLVTVAGYLDVCQKR